MQIDMHYYGTFAMAYAAGITPQHAQIIATSAQLVDDNNFTNLYLLESGQGIEGVATAHHPLEAGQRALGLGANDDSRTVWVPFHFLPGNEGETFQEQVLCRKNSQLAQTMVNYYTKKETVESHREHCLQLIGIGAHVYADTFSHYGFSGLTSELNDVDTSTIKTDERHSPDVIDYIRRRFAEFEDMFSAGVGNSVRLGHGAVATFPDRPFLKWSYLQSDGLTRLERDNPATFLEGCSCLFDYFSRFRSVFYADGAKPRVSFSEITSAVGDILSREFDAQGRTAAWVDGLKAGRIGPPVDVPIYSASTWLEALKSGAALELKGGKVASEGYNFFVAADYHRNFVLKRLLPEAGLFVA